MLFNDLNDFNIMFEEQREDESPMRADFPLFNMQALRDSFTASDFVYVDKENLDDILEEITCKKSKRNNGAEAVIVKKRGRKAVNKNGKAWDDPTITMKEIIDNDLAGEPTAAELEARHAKMRKMREAKAAKRAARLNGENVDEKKNEEKTLNVVASVNTNTNTNMGQIVFKDGKLVIENPVVETQKTQELTLIENGKKGRVTSMSFRTKNHTAKWTEDETRKFYKAIEIFGADFSMIAKLFENRNRNQIKNKFNKESKVNAKLVDEAFKKNSVIAQRSIMNQIKNFNENFQALENGTTTIEEIAPVNMERGASNTSTDSMDFRIMGEIQNIFVKEIRGFNPVNDINNVDNFFNLNENQNGLFLTKDANTDDDEIESPIMIANANPVFEEFKLLDVAVGQKRNLLLG